MRRILCTCAILLLSLPTVALSQDATEGEHPLVTDVKEQLGKRKHTLPFIMVIDLQCKKETRADFVAAMRIAIAETRKEEGNVRYQLVADPKDQTQFQMYEQWRNMDGFLAHMKAPYIAELESKLGDLLEGDIELKVMVPVPNKAGGKKGGKKKAK